MVRNLGWMAAEFARFPKYSKANIEKILVLDGNENFLDAREQGKRRPHSDGAHWSVGALFLCPRPLWLPAPFHGAGRWTISESMLS